MKKIFVIVLVLCIALGAVSALAACEPEKQKIVWPTVTSDELYVKKVDNLPEDFIMGMDASSVPSLEKGGVKFYDFEGNETDVYKVLAMNGINYIRVRIWNDPFDADGNGYGGGNCDIANAIEIGKRATQYGMKLLANFHYSDFWADPAKQMVPKAWAGMSIEDKEAALYAYTKDCLNQLKAAGVDVGMVQVGNETNGAMCGETKWYRIAKLMSAGSRAVREVFPDALVGVHFANPEKVSNYKNYAFELSYGEVDYDVFISSYYPYWHGTLDNLSSLLSEIAEEYGKKVMVGETSYAYTPADTDFYGNTISDGGAVTKDYPYTVQGQANCMREIIDTVANKTTNGIGVVYWEGTWISAGGASYEENLAKWEANGSGWASSYASEYDPNDAGLYHGGCAVDNQAFFDASGHPIESLKVWSLVRGGNTVEIKPDAIEDTTIICDLNGELVLPTHVNAVMNDNSKQSIPVEWQNVDMDAMYNGGVAKYDIVGTAGGMTAHCYVSMVETNFLQDYSFEENSSVWVATPTGNMSELYNENKVTDSLTGNRHYHFWSSAKNSVEFTLEQEVSNLRAGAYKYAISIMGGDGGATEIYAYVKINGEIVAQESLELSGYGNWNTALIERFEYDGTSTLVVGIYVKCEGSGAGAWGKIDDALLNSVGD